MKIPLDFLLRLIENLSNELNLEKISKKIKEYFEDPEEDYSDILSEINLKKIIKDYICTNKDLKKKLKAKVKKMEEKQDEEENNDKEVEKEEKITTKKRKRTLSTTKEEKIEKKIKNKKKEEDDIDLEKEVKFIPKPKCNTNPDRIPFKRVDDSKDAKKIVPENLRDNSYAAFMKQTGDDFGKAASEKLIVTRGKGFKREKTKFKNKTFHGGMNISTTVRSIPLEDDDDSSNN